MDSLYMNPSRGASSRRLPREVSLTRCILLSSYTVVAYTERCFNKKLCVTIILVAP